MLVMPKPYLIIQLLRIITYIAMNLQLYGILTISMRIIMILHDQFEKMNTKSGMSLLLNAYVHWYFKNTLQHNQ